MRIISKHIIAIVMTALFVFPLAFQAIHVVAFHNHKHSTCKHTTAVKHDNTIQFVSVEEECLVCEYTFSVADTPDNYIGRKVDVFYFSPQLELYTFCLETFFSVKSPRAPPLV